MSRAALLKKMELEIPYNACWRGCSDKCASSVQGFDRRAAVQSTKAHSSDGNQGRRHEANR